MSSNELEYVESVKYAKSLKYVKSQIHAIQTGSQQSKVES